MTPTTLSLLVLLFAALLFAGVLQLVAASPEFTPRPKRAYAYEALFRQPGAKLPRRPEGMASLKAEIAKAPTSTVHVERSVLIGLPADGFVATPEWRMPKHRKTPDWTTTEEHQLAWGFFDGEPDDLAVQRKWDGAGLVKVA